MHHTHSSQFFERSIYVSNSQPVKARWQDKCLLMAREQEQGSKLKELCDEIQPN